MTPSLPSASAGQVELSEDVIAEHAKRRLDRVRNRYRDELLRFPLPVGDSKGIIFTGYFTKGMDPQRKNKMASTSVLEYMHSLYIT